MNTRDALDQKNPKETHFPELRTGLRSFRVNGTREFVLTRLRRDGTPERSYSVSSLAAVMKDYPKPPVRITPKTPANFHVQGYTVCSWDGVSKLGHPKKTDPIDCVIAILRKGRMFYVYRWYKGQNQEDDKEFPIEPIGVYQAHSWYQGCAKRNKIISEDDAFPNYRLYFKRPGIMTELPPEAGLLPEENADAST